MSGIALTLRRRQLGSRALDLAVRATSALERRYAVALAVLVVAQWAVVAYEALSSIRHNGVLYYHGGDGTWYWTTAWTLSSLHVPQAVVGYGWSFLLAPFAAIAGPNMLAGLPFVLVLDLVVLAPLALLAFAAIANRIAGRLFALWAAVVWVVVPPLAVHFYRASNRETFVDDYLPMARGLNALADYPSLVCCLVAAWLLLRTLDRRDWTNALAAGVATGFLIGIKPANALFLAAAGVVLVAARRPVVVAAFAGGLLPAVLTLAVWKQTGLGHLPLLSLGETREAAGQTLLAFDPTHGYVKLDWHHLRENKDALREVFWSMRLLEFVLVGGTVALLLRAPVHGVFVAAWFLAYFVVKGSAAVASVYTTSFYRLLEPAYPAYVLLAAGVVLAFPVGRRRRAERAERDRARAATVRPLGRRTLAAVVVVFAILPLAVAVAARPVPEGRTALVAAEGLEVPIVDFHLTAKRVERGVLLRWDAQSSHGVRGSYRLFRGRTDGCSYPADGARECQFALPVLRNTRGEAYVDYDVHGTLVYRVALAADWTGSRTSNDVLLLGEPVRIDVP